MTIAQTDRLLLRRFVPDDLDALMALYADPEVRRHIPDAPTNRDEARRELEWHRNGHRERPELGLWATIHRGTGAFIGRCGLLPWAIDGRDEVEVAYLLDRAYWGQGLATEAARAIVAYAFEQLHLTRLVCLIEPGNTASARVAGKIGMTFEREAEDDLGAFWLYSRSR